MLSGRWDDFGGQLPIMGSLKFCSRHSWRLKGDLQQSLSLVMFLNLKGYGLWGAVCIREEVCNWIGGGLMLVALGKGFMMVKFG